MPGLVRGAELDEMFVVRIDLVSEGVVDSVLSATRALGGECSHLGHDLRQKHVNVYEGKQFAASVSWRENKNRTEMSGIRTDVRHASHRLVLVSMIGPIDSAVEKVFRVPFMFQRQSMTTRSRFIVQC